MRLSPENLTQSYESIEISNTLKALVEFDHTITDGGHYAEGFELCTPDYYVEALKITSEDSTFISGLIPFAQANHSGSFYAFWLKDGIKDITNAPIVVFGDEGGQFVVAKDLDDLLRMIALDNEAFILSEGVSFEDEDEDEDWDDDEDEDWDDEDDDDNHNNANFKAWLADKLGKTPYSNDEVDGKVKEAMKAYQKSFETWVLTFQN